MRSLPHFATVVLPELDLSAPKAPSNALLTLRVTTAKASFKLLETRRQNENANRFRPLLHHLPRPLSLDLEYHVSPRLQGLLDRFERSTVIVAPILRPLQEASFLDTAEEFVARQKMVLNPVGLIGPLCPSGGGDGHNKIGKFSNQTPNECAFTSPRGTTDDDKPSDLKRTQPTQWDYDLVRRVTSSARCRGVRPITVFAELIRHSSRI